MLLSVSLASEISTDSLIINAALPRAILLLLITPVNPKPGKTVGCMASVLLALAAIMALAIGCSDLASSPAA